MATQTGQLAQEMRHDFLRERRWLSTLSGFSASTSVAYGFYRLIVLFTIVYMNAMAAYACVLEPKKQLIVKATHFMSVGVYYIFWCVSFRLVHYRALEKTSALLNSGVYRYEDEEEDEAIAEMRESMPVEIRRKSNAFISMFYVAGLITTTAFPLSQLLFLPDVGTEQGIINPYLPHLFYQPFDTRHLRGTIAGWLVGNVMLFFVYTINCTVNWYYINGIVQMKVHFRILNHSISNIPKRALFMFAKKGCLLPRLTSDQLLENEDYQQCLYLSFRSNVQHHQALLRLRKYFEPFSGSFALCVFILAPIVYGCLLYLLFQVNPLNVTINLILTFAADQFTVIFICFLGEDVISESEQVFSSLYNTDWFNYNKRFKQVLHIMMSNTIKPVGVKALLVGVPASFETYSHVMSAMYKVTSLVRQSDLV